MYFFFFPHMLIFLIWIALSPSGSVKLVASVTPIAEPLPGPPLPGVLIVVTDEDVFQSNPITSVDFDISTLQDVLLGIIDQLGKFDLGFGSLGKTISMLPHPLSIIRLQTLLLSPHCLREKFIVLNYLF
jgi:hypothetical protein